MYEIDDVYEEMTRQFEFINDEINFLLNSQKDTIGNLQQYLQSNTSNIYDKRDKWYFYLLISDNLYGAIKLPPRS